MFSVGIGAGNSLRRDSERNIVQDLVAIYESTLFSFLVSDKLLPVMPACVIIQRRGQVCMTF